MNDQDWNKRRDRAILTAFETGRPVFADSEGVFRFADGDREEIPFREEPPAAKPPRNPYRDPGVTPAHTPRARREAYRVHVASAPPAARPPAARPRSSWWSRVKAWFTQ